MYFLCHCRTQFWSIQVDCSVFNFTHIWGCSFFFGLSTVNMWAMFALTLNDLVGVSLELQAQTWLLQWQGFIPQTDRPRGYVSSLHRSYYLPRCVVVMKFLVYVLLKQKCKQLMCPGLIQVFSCSKLHQKHWPPSFCIWDSEVVLAHAEELVCTSEKNEWCSKEVARGG